MGAFYDMSTAIQHHVRKRTAVSPELLAGQLTRLRPLAEEDLPVLQAWDEDPTIIALMGPKFDMLPASEWLTTLQSQHRCFAWGIEDQTGRLIGELELDHVDWRTRSAELRICIGAEECRGRGYGTDALRTALRLAFTELALDQVYLRVFASNAPALRVYQRLGFRREAVLRPIARRHDPAPVVLMSLTRDQWAASFQS